MISILLTLLLLQSTLQTDFPPSITMHKAIALLAIFMVVAALANGAPMPWVVTHNVLSYQSATTIKLLAWAWFFLLALNIMNSLLKLSLAPTYFKSIFIAATAFCQPQGWCVNGIHEIYLKVVKFDKKAFLCWPLAGIMIGPTTLMLTLTLTANLALDLILPKILLLLKLLRIRQIGHPG